MISEYVYHNKIINVPIYQVYQVGNLPIRSLSVRKIFELVARLRPKETSSRHESNKRV